MPRSPFYLLLPTPDDTPKDRYDKGQASLAIQALLYRFTSPNREFGFTYDVQTGVIIFTCSHPGAYKFKVRPTLAMYRRTKGWKNAIREVRDGHRQRCPEARGE